MQQLHDLQVLISFFHMKTRNLLTCMQRERDMAIASDRYDVAVAAQVRSKMPRNLQGAAVAMFVFSTGFIGTRFAHM